MTEFTLELIIISTVTVIVLAAWIALVFYVDAHTGWRRQVPSGHDMADQAAPAAARRREESVDNASRQTAGSPAVGPDVGASTEPAAGTAAGKARAG
jgi:hypothetical protein